LQLASSKETYQQMNPLPSLVMCKAQPQALKPAKQSLQKQSLGYGFEMAWAWPGGWESLS